MVSISNVVETNSICICGNGDSTTAQKGYFENKCPNCGNEGTLQVETLTNSEVSNHINTNYDESSDDSNNNTQSNNNTENNSNSNTNNVQGTKIICKNCGSEYCGQDGYDTLGGTRASLTKVNPSEITDEEDEEVSSTEEGETTYMSGWEGLCDLLKPLDGQAMMVQRGDYVVIKKIEMPQTARLWAYEGINVVNDSVTVTDYTPEIYNTFIIKWGESFENELEFVFNKHKQLFGERKTVMEAKKINVVEEESSDDEGKNNEEDDSNKNATDNNSVSNSILNASNSENTNLSNIDTSNMDLSDTSSIDGSESDSDAPQTEEVPITTKEEAIQFGMTQVGKAKREDGHTIELKVIGNSNWQMGEWCHVKLPSFNEDSYMFISKCSFESSPDNEYINSLTLVDYPPSLGKPKKNTKQDENSDEDSDANNDLNTDSNSDNSENSTNSENNESSTGSESSNNPN